MAQSRTKTTKKKSRSKRRTTTRTGTADRKVYKTVEVTATSPECYCDAVKLGVAKAAETVRGLSWWEVTDQRGRIDQDTGTIDEFQITLAIHFEVE